MWEKKVLEIAQTYGIGAQFGGKYFAHDVRVVRLPRHGASCPVGLGVSLAVNGQGVDTPPAGPKPTRASAPLGTTL